MKASNWLYNGILLVAIVSILGCSDQNKHAFVSIEGDTIFLGSSLDIGLKSKGVNAYQSQGFVWSEYSNVSNPECNSIGYFIKESECVFGHFRIEIFTQEETVLGVRLACRGFNCNQLQTSVSGRIWIKDAMFDMHRLQYHVRLYWDMDADNKLECVPYMFSF